MVETATAQAPAKTASGGNILQVRNLEAWYGESHILHGINFDVNAGEVVTLLGRNGAGKTTTLKSIMGIIGKRTGSVKFNNQDIIRTTSDKIARMGIAFCPEERGIFSSLDVRENLMLPPVVRPGGLPLEQIFDLFPNLKERLNSQGTKLSGGEQQMLAIARILRTGANFLMLDEPTEGLAPVIIQQIGHTIARLKKERVLRSSWSSRTSASHPPSPTAITWSSTARSLTDFPMRSLPPTWTSSTPISAFKA
ncbi:branched-chain amino acid transport system ATP-binding protein [Bradyrhizobium sp. LM3.6]